jgi:predicted dinucleotide-binding enzyme
MVGKALGTKLAELGHEVRMGSRSATSEAAAEWVAAAGEGASQGTFADAADHGELVLNCTAGAGAVDAVSSAADKLRGKVLVDVANPLDFSGGGLPSLFVAVTDSLGEQVQRAVPEARVVKALSTMNADVMVDPDSVPGDHVAFICGDDEGAKEEVVRLLGEVGWPGERVLDLGDLSAARGMEAYLLLWLRMMNALGTARFNVALPRG